MKVSVDPIGCRAHGLCADVLPELVRLDEWGYPIVASGSVPPELVTEARRAAAACPALAFRLRKEESPVVASPPRH
ncbi:ferredoxin [Amycolatopsis sp. NBC_01488]|uniref:ferredoxin n=1 Tax=Amycolatopsis sp. NBC_01488 TaxID=2903563 RepID=UPI002E296496|nr:ferredoxin [Amycolatopsis sp. NBC_01488]